MLWHDSLVRRLQPARLVALVLVLPLPIGAHEPPAVRLDLDARSRASLARPEATAQERTAGPLVTRGPYLQQATSQRMIVRWRTDVQTDSRVSYGPAPDDLPFVVDDLTMTREHEILLDSLEPHTVYFYSVGTTTQPLAGGDASTFFVSPPAAGSSQPTRIWVIGDSGTADSNAAAVRDAYLDFTGPAYTNLWLMLGDNAYPDGTDSQYQAAVFDMYPTLLRQTPLWPTLGNHDGHSSDSDTQTGPYFDAFSLPTAGEAGGIASGTEAYYSFDHGNVHFIVLDSHDSDRTIGGPMITWMDSDLAVNNADWVIAYWHHPPYSKGRHDSDTESKLIQMRENAVPILEAHGVDLVLTGHSHSYERSVLLDGHYGTSDTLTMEMILDGGDGRPAGDGPYGKPHAGPAPHEGTIYGVVGSSSRTSRGALDHPVMTVSLQELGSLVLDVAGSQLSGTFIDDQGTIRDTFMMVKGSEIFQDGFESGDTSAWDAAGIAASPLSVRDRTHELEH